MIVKYYHPEDSVLKTQNLTAILRGLFTWGMLGIGRAFAGFAGSDDDK